METGYIVSLLGNLFAAYLQYFCFLCFRTMPIECIVVHMLVHECLNVHQYKMSLM